MRLQYNKLAKCLH